MSESYRITIGTNEWAFDGSPIRTTLAEFEHLADALAYEKAHGGVIERDTDGKNLTPDGIWI